MLLILTESSTQSRLELRAVSLKQSGITAASKVEVTIHLAYPKYLKYIY
jgi:hypothetical protein